MDSILSERRFKALRAALSFKASVSPEELKKDPAARIRPILNTLKKTAPRYVELGRNISLDEASVACKSKFGRGLIVFNPKKPTGKYHFKLYVVTCATSWIAVNYRLHCDTDMLTRLDGVVETAEATALHQETADTMHLRSNVSEIRRTVLEVVRPLYWSNRIINSDNYYTSIQLLEALKVKGIYGRGTIKHGSMHFPAHVVLPDPKQRARGDCAWGIDSDRKILAVSWYDGSIVNMVSNADASEMSTVQRTIKGTSTEIPAPVCVKEYNKYMQGVDRLDQLRSRFSVSDGHTFKKWHKKLAMAIFDIARFNAYMTRKLVVKTNSRDRDPHRTFVMQLTHELLFGLWESVPSDHDMLNRAPCDLNDAPTPTRMHRPPRAPTTPSGAEVACEAVASKQIYPASSRKKRVCLICRWEGRYCTEVTDFCITHQVCLCKNVATSVPGPYCCEDVTLTCWQKFHQFYLPAGLFSAKGNVRKSSRLYKLYQSHKLQLAQVDGMPGSASSGADGSPFPSPLQSEQSIDYARYLTPESVTPETRPTARHLVM